MPNVGTRLPHPVSHTSTHQWQSFEIRMRHRRAERCVQRAEAALDAGMEEDARAALAEASTLNRDTPDFNSLRSTVLERRAAAIAATKRARAQRAAAVGIASLVLVAATVAMWPSAERGTAGTGIPAPAASTAPAAPSSSAPPASTPTNAAPTEPSVSSKTSGPSMTDAVAPTSGETEKPADPLPVALPVAPSPATPEPTLPAIEQTEPQLRLAPSTTETTAAATAPPSTNGADRLVTDLPAATMPIPRTAPPPPPTEPPAPTPDPRTIEEAHVRSVLAQFEAAYNSLSAQAAQAVWPTVDERSLARAFDNLASQRVTLGQCSIDVTGASASAECAGRTSWTPKVGGGRHTESRRWLFVFAKADGVWRIEHAEAR